MVFSDIIRIAIELEFPDIDRTAGEGVSLICQDYWGGGFSDIVKIAWGGNALSYSGLLGEG